jgi:hypothetical protein
MLPFLQEVFMRQVPKAVVAVLAIIGIIAVMVGNYPAAIPPFFATAIIAVNEVCVAMRDRRV